MKRILSTSILAATLSLALAADASAWTRNTTRSGPAGTATFSATGSCANGVCNRSATRTTPYGNQIQTQNSTVCANGTCTRSSTSSGSYGGSINRQTTISR
ncbi:hypothetical protein [Roseibium aggregatum]|uniref:Uncharacterized protein n=1 Tax=Roseibium aggregatum TaxID=187304 RepID=A0A939EG00_9HYPH|nr:hypothetical protein [Roseibium aggregatum]MBN9670854.1 hypothetical protein [Roseibium aggregatum]